MGRGLTSFSLPLKRPTNDAAKAMYGGFRRSLANNGRRFLQAESQRLVTAPVVRPTLAARPFLKPFATLGGSQWCQKVLHQSRSVQAPLEEVKFAPMAGPVS